MSGSLEAPYSFPDAVSAREAAAGHEHLEAGESSGEIVRVAGRLMRNRPQGKVSFAELRDWTGSIQLFAQGASTENFEDFVHLSLGDWVGATGEIVRTRRGELSVAVRSWSLLAPARRGFGDKWRGVVDVEVRHRQREVDLWANEGVRDRFLERSRVIEGIRRRLWDEGFVEVETPVLQPLASGGHAKPFVTHFNSLHADFYLKIAHEIYLKRLVVGGFEKVFELGRIFRNEGLSPRHNPEFTMLEAYAVHWDYRDMARLIERLVVGAALDLHGTTVLPGDDPIDVAPPWPEMSMTDAIASVTGEELSITDSVEELRAAAARLGVEVGPGRGPGAIIFDIYEHTTESELRGPVHVIDYPEEVSPLVRRHRSTEGLVERLTPVIGGVEIGESYSELVDPDEQRRRLVAQMELRAAGDEDAMELDEEFLRALEHGMPPTGGIGIGIDRMVMKLLGVANIREVILFPALRPDTVREDDSGD